MEGLQTDLHLSFTSGITHSPPIAQMLAGAFWKLLSLRPEQMQLAERKQEAFEKQQEMNRQGAHSQRPWQKIQRVL